MEPPTPMDVLESLPHYLYVYDVADGVSHFFGQHLGLDLGYSQDELDAMGPGFLAALLHPDDLARLPELLARYETSGDRTLETEHRLRHKDGTWRWFLGRDRALSRDAQGHLSRIIGTSFDITQRKALEARVIGDQRLDALTVLAGGVAHDLRNLLQVMFSQVELARLAKRPEDLAAELGHLEAVVRRASDLSSNLLTFARKGDLRPRPVELDALVGGMAGVLQSALGPQTELDVVLGAPQAVVEADPTQLEQVVLNLVFNAREAMPDGGVVRVRTSRLSARAGASAWVRLTVDDEGPGVAPHLRDRVFEPFFTTKPGGTGLGLATLYGIVRQSGGEIHVGSSAQGGAAFHVDLPERRVDPAS